MSDEPKQYALLRRILKALGLSEDRVDELVATIQSWLSDDKREAETSTSYYPYHLRDDFLSPAELAFYRVLQTAVSDWALLFTKVNLGDLFYASTGDYGQNQVYRNKIARKHIDFLLCDPETIRPLLGIELDDSSHKRPDRQQRDRFVDGLFAAAKLPLVHVPVSGSYPADRLRVFLQQKAGVKSGSGVAVEETAETAVPNCPECGSPMIRRQARSGARAGSQFWGCSHYPRCRGIIPIDKTG